MATVVVFPSFISVQSPAPSKSFGTLANVPIKNGVYEVLTRAKMPSIPAGSIITSATYRVAQNDNWTGTNVLGLHRNLTSWLATETWGGRPAAVSAASGTDSQAGTHALDWWEIDVTADVQGWYAKTIKYNWGWVLRTNSSTKHYVRGKEASSGHPHLVIEYEPPAKVPSGLSPAGGAVSVAKPTLTFDTSGNTIAIQVQLDAAADAVSPDFDSGEVAATGGVLDLTTTAYAGLADGSSIYWRARAKSSAGWSGWSSWVQFSRDNLDAVTLTAPASTTADTSPPFAWTFAGTQRAWQADEFLVEGGRTTLLRSSGLRSGTDNDWTPAPLVGAYFGKTLRARVRVWDNVTRIATPGTPTYSEDTADFVASFTGTVDPMDTLVATQAVVNSPGVTLSGTRAAGIPDEVAIFHDDVMVARLDGADVFTSTTVFSFTDWWARMGEEVEITVVPIVNGDFADDAPAATITPRCRGLWLVDPATGTKLVLWETDLGSGDQGDLAAIMQTVDGQIIRRRLANAPRAGSYSGQIFDALGFDAGDTIAAFDEFRANDASTVYRLLRGKENLAVIAGDFIHSPTEMENLDDEVYSAGSFNWWEAAAPVVVDGG